MTKLDKFQEMIDNNLGDLSKYDDHYVSGLIGGNKPSTYSKSPVMWNGLFEQVGIKAIYFTFDYSPEKNIEELLDVAIEHGKFVNFNVTDPFKESLYKVLKKGSESKKYNVEFSHDADFLSAVNHLLFDEKGKMYALNTDGVALVRSVREVVYDLVERDVLMIGAGGAAKSIAYSFFKNNVHLTILNRTEEKAHNLAKLLKTTGDTKGSVLSGGLDMIEDYSLKANLIIQAVTKGTPISYDLAKKINPQTLFVDIRYGEKAEFKKLGQETGHPAIDGSGMVFWQFVEAAERLSEIRKDFKVKKEYFDEISKEVLK